MSGTVSLKQKEEELRAVGQMIRVISESSHILHNNPPYLKLLSDYLQLFRDAANVEESSDGAAAFDA